MSKIIKYCSDKIVDIVLSLLFGGGGAVLLGVRDSFPYTYIFLFFLIAFLVVLMISNTIRSGYIPPSRNEEEQKKTNFTAKNSLTNKDIEFLLGGEFLDKTSFRYDKPKEFNKGFSLTSSDKMTIALQAPKNSYATVRFNFVLLESQSHEESLLITHIYDSTRKDRIITGEINEFKVLLDDNSSFDISVRRKKDAKDKLVVAKLLIQLIHWKKNWL